MILLTGSFLSVTFREKEKKGSAEHFGSFLNHDTDTDTSDGQESKEKRRGGKKKRFLLYTEHCKAARFCTNNPDHVDPDRLMAA